MNQCSSQEEMENNNTSIRLFSSCSNIETCPGGTHSHRHTHSHTHSHSTLKVGISVHSLRLYTRVFGNCTHKHIHTHKIFCFVGSRELDEAYISIDLTICWYCHEVYIWQTQTKPFCTLAYMYVDYAMKCEEYWSEHFMVRWAWMYVENVAEPWWGIEPYKSAWMQVGLQLHTSTSL